MDIKTGRSVVKIDPRYFRPTEVDSLLGDASKARAQARLEGADLIRHSGAGNGRVGPRHRPARCTGSARGLQNLPPPGVTRRRGARSRNKKKPGLLRAFFPLLVFTNDRRRRRRNCRGSRHRRHRRPDDRRRCGACPELRSHEAGDRPCPGR